jgi:ABC-type nitrate/sulfonate/bicarbonate transport system substrate-binding protein
MNLVYMRSGTTAAQALLAGEIDFGHLPPAPMLALGDKASISLG